jgi:hypothetical protein
MACLLLQGNFLYILIHDLCLPALDYLNYFWESPLTYDHEFRFGG